MLNVTGQKVLMPTIIFALLNSGLVWFINNGKNAHAFGAGLLINALVFVLSYYVLIKVVLKKNVTQADIVVSSLLFILLTPGVLLTLPPGSGGVLMSGQTSAASTAVHSLVYAVLFAWIRTAFPQYY